MDIIQDRDQDQNTSMDHQDQDSSLDHQAVVAAPQRNIRVERGPKNDPVPYKQKIPLTLKDLQAWFSQH